MKTKSMKFSLILILLFAFVGCAGPSAKKMLPSLNFDQISTSDKTLKVAKISGGQESQFGGMEKLNNETFETAILDSLIASRLYKDVSDERAGDYDLFADILFQESTVGPGLAYNTYLIISYKLIDTKSQKEILRKILSSSSTSTAFAGGTRMVEALEGATQKNISKLIFELSKLEKQDQNLAIFEPNVKKQKSDKEQNVHNYADNHISFKTFYDQPFDYKNYTEKYTEDMISTGQLVSVWKDPSANFEKYKSFTLKKFGGKLLPELKDFEYEPYLTLLNKELTKYFDVENQPSNIETSNAANLEIKGEMAECNPGNRALRYVVSFGAGQASLILLSEIYEPNKLDPSLCIYIRVPGYGGIFGGDSDEMLKSMVRIAAGFLRISFSEQTGL